MLPGVVTGKSIPGVGESTRVVVVEGSRRVVGVASRLVGVGSRRVVGVASRLVGVGSRRVVGVASRLVVVGSRLVVVVVGVSGLEVAERILVVVESGPGVVAGESRLEEAESISGEEESRPVEVGRLMEAGESSPEEEEEEIGRVEEEGEEEESRPVVEGGMPEVVENRQGAGVVEIEPGLGKQKPLVVLRTLMMTSAASNAGQLLRDEDQVGGLGYAWEETVLGLALALED
ncbi:hypothetical protein MLD38_023351 [Melastoma candidum]|uniref:Uncharacterized protein n=1 Tax=Melastoma candidum TaxID=119954 RepID=A0ACB9QR67_9MYRT|nr:hypothetical protein MLD38_023351 [Melastoma candidum]